MIMHIHLEATGSPPDGSEVSSGAEIFLGLPQGSQGGVGLVMGGYKEIYRGSLLHCNLRTSRRSRALAVHLLVRRS